MVADVLDTGGGSQKNSGGLVPAGVLQGELRLGFPFLLGGDWQIGMHLIAPYTGLPDRINRLVAYQMITQQRLRFVGPCLSPTVRCNRLS